MGYAIREAYPMSPVSSERLANAVQLLRLDAEFDLHNISWRLAVGVAQC